MNLNGLNGFTVLMVVYCVEMFLWIRVWLLLFLITSQVFSVSLLSLISISLLFLHENLYSLIFSVSWVRACVLEDAFLSNCPFGISGCSFGAQSQNIGSYSLYRSYAKSRKLGAFKR